MATPPPSGTPDNKQTERQAERQREWDETHQSLMAVVEEKEQRKLRARRQGSTVWFGLGTFGMIGWSVAVPVLLAVALGVWIDQRWPSPYSWTLMLLFVGFVVGCANAWYWVMREHRMIQQGQDADTDEWEENRYE
jgi:ATP synthase protein I